MGIHVCTDFHGLCNGKNVGEICQAYSLAKLAECWAKVVIAAILLPIKRALIYWLVVPYVNVKVKVDISPKYGKERNGNIVIDGVGKGLFCLLNN